MKCSSSCARSYPGSPPPAARARGDRAAFHRRLPDAAQRLPLPERYWTARIRRYGFHGLSYEYVAGHLGADLGPRSIIAHLGSGASLVALRDDVPVDTTMSVTPGGGLVMATRSGDLDPRCGAPPSGPRRERGAGRRGPRGRERPARHFSVRALALTERRPDGVLELIDEDLAHLVTACRSEPEAPPPTTSSRSCSRRVDPTTTSPSSSSH